MEISVQILLYLNHFLKRLNNLLSFSIVLESNPQASQFTYSLAGNIGSLPRPWAEFMLCCAYILRSGHQYWLPICFQVQFKVVIFTIKPPMDLEGQGLIRTSSFPTGCPPVKICLLNRYPCFQRWVFQR